MTHGFVVHIRRKPGLSDPEGATTAKALRDLGFSGVGAVSFGRTITIEVDAESQDVARSELDDMCRKLLANPVIEHYTIDPTS
jgi:phosphoribosylformylglycinamidine synthase